MLFFFQLVIFQDGDGELGAGDMKVYWTKLKSLLTKNLPNSGGFSIGFLYGIQQWRIRICKMNDNKDSNWTPATYLSWKTIKWSLQEHVFLLCEKPICQKISRTKRILYISWNRVQLYFQISWTTSNIIIIFMFVSSLTSMVVMD